MRSPAAAIAWEFRQRHRWGLVALGVYLLALAAIKTLVIGSGLRVNLDTSESFAFVVVVPMAAAFTYFLAVFTFGFAGDFAARQSIYPARMFTLPVPTKALAGWPLLYGSAAIAVLWLATRLLAVWPAGVNVPVIWPAFLAAGFLAWTQALTWMPYGLRGLRVIVATLWLSTIDAVVLIALHYNTSEFVMIAILAPLVPLAYFATCFAVARARRGDIPDWSAFVRIGQHPRRLYIQRPEFLSAARAQAWFEWRRHGLSLPVMAGILLPFELGLLFLVRDTSAFVFEVMVIMLLTAPLMALFVAATVSYRVTPFIATRPVVTTALIAGKVKATIRSTLVTWVLVVIAIALAFTSSDIRQLVTETAREIKQSIGAARGVVILLLIFCGLILSTWKHLVQSLYIGLTGRDWVTKGSVFLVLVFLFLLGPIIQWILDSPEVQHALWDALPLVLGILAGVKLIAAVWIVTRMHVTGLLSDRTLVTGAGAWCAVVVLLYSVLVWILSTPFFPRYVLALLSILAIPLVRLSAAPLALAWNRHR